MTIQLIIPLVVFFSVFLLMGGMLNYLDTGKVCKILPGHRLRFWLASVGMGLFGALATQTWRLLP
jgi:hypothetical protein